LVQRTPTEGSYQQSLFGKFLGTVAVNVSRVLCYCLERKALTRKAERKNKKERKEGGKIKRKFASPP
jgi:hypothetical protein